MSITCYHWSVQHTALATTGVFDTPASLAPTGVSDTPASLAPTGVSDTPASLATTGVSNTQHLPPLECPTHQHYLPPLEFRRTSVTCYHWSVWHSSITCAPPPPPPPPPLEGPTHVTCHHWSVRHTSVTCYHWSVRHTSLATTGVSGTSGPCITTVTWCCRNNFSQWTYSFLLKLRWHWLKALRQHVIAVVRLGPASLANTDNEVTHMNNGLTNNKWTIEKYYHNTRIRNK